MIEVQPDGTLRQAQLTFIPVAPKGLEFCLLVRRTLLELRPKTLAVQLSEALAEHYRAAVDRMPQMSVIAVGTKHADEDELEAEYLPIEPADPLIEALRTARDIDAEIVFMPAVEDDPTLDFSYPDSASVDVIGPQAYLDQYRRSARVSDPKAVNAAQAYAWKLQGLDPFVTNCAVITLPMLKPLLAAIQEPQDEPIVPARPVPATLFNLHPNCLAEITSEIPFFQQLYNELRWSELAHARIQRARWQLDLLRQAESEYVIKTGDEVRPWQRIALAKFSRNLALLDRELYPGAYDLTLAARSLADDNLAYEVWEMANRYSEQQTEDPPLETLDLPGQALWQRIRSMRIRRRLPRLKQRLRPAGLKERKRESKPGEWAQQSNGNSICSYPPEDLVIENYGRFLKQHARSVLSAERSRVEPFLASTRDGIDLRETVRNWHQGKLYVREDSHSSADVGAVVIIFDEDRDNRYTYLTTWLGEHQNESDMAFYSTDPFANIVGPGIGRGEYGGLLMTLPPRRMYDVWNDYDYEMAETKAERLLMAALDYSLERHVIYVAAKPPRSIFRSLAARANRQIVYFPLGQLSPSKLKKVRVVHVLDSYERRQNAAEYIW